MKIIRSHDVFFLYLNGWPYFNIKTTGIRDLKLDTNSIYRLAS